MQFKNLVKVRVRDLPMAYVTFSNVICVLGYPSPFILIQVSCFLNAFMQPLNRANRNFRFQFGWIVSWAYLRFFKINEGGVRGDRSETFSLVSWFPPFMHRPVTFISNTLYGVFVKVGVIEPWQYSALGDVELGVGSGLPSMNVGITGMSSGGGPAMGTSIGSGGGGGATAGGGGTRAEAERRRAMALKALDQRVKAGTQGTYSNGPPNRSNGAATSPTTSTMAPISPPATRVPSYPPTAATGDTLKDPKSPKSPPLANGKASTKLPAVVVQQASPLQSEETSGDLGASSVTSPR